MKALRAKKVRKKSAEFTLYSVTRNITLFLAFVWTFFHFATASSHIKFDLDGSLIIHLSFAVIISILAFPTFRKIRNNKVYYYNLTIAGIFAACAIFFYFRLQYIDSANSSYLDIMVALVFIIIFYESIRRAESNGVFIFSAIAAAAFYIYFLVNFFSNPGKDQLYDLLFNKTISKNALFSSPLEISENYIFIFAIFAALFFKNGAARYFTILPFALLGNSRGMASKSSIFLSAFHSLFDGPRNSFALHDNKLKEKIEKDSLSKQNIDLINFAYSIIPQIMPPVLGVAAFLIIEYAEVPYSAVLKAIFLPAITLYICLLFLLYNSARSINRRSRAKERLTTLLFYIMGLILLMIISSALYYLFAYIKLNFNDIFLHQIFVLLIVFYIFMTALEAKIPDLETYKFEKENFRRPKITHLIIWGMHYLIPLSFFIAIIITEPEAPDFAAYLTSLLLIIILITRKPIKAVLRRRGKYLTEFLEGVRDIKNAFIHAAFAMSHIAITLAIVGFISGIIITTGFGTSLVYFFDSFYIQNLALLLPLVILICIFLSAAVSAVISFSIAAITLIPVISNLLSNKAINSSTLSLNLFILFYCLIGPVLAPYLLKAMKKAKKQRKEFYDELRIISIAMLLPLFFLFNERFILAGLNSISSTAETVSRLIGGSLLICCAVSGYFIIKNKKWQNYALFIAALLLINPKILQNVISPEFNNYPGHLILEKIETIPHETKIRLTLEGTDYIGEERVSDYILILKPGRSAEKRLQEKGIKIEERENGQIEIADIVQDSFAENLGIEPGFTIKEFGVNVRQKYKAVPYIFSGFIIILILVLQLEKILPKISKPKPEK